MKHKKIAIIGAGAVGSTTAYALMLQNITAEIILIDIDEKRCKGEILDLSDALSFCGTSKISGSTVQDAAQADIIIISAGTRQQPGQDRLMLVNKNRTVITNILKQITPFNQQTIIIMITNPVDILTLHAQQLTNLPPGQVFGSGTFLDTERLRGILSKKLAIAEQSIDAYILGEHGDTQFPAWSSAHIAGIPLLNFPGIKEDNLDQIAKETRQKAYDIITCKGATYYGIAACVATICRAILFDQKLILPLSCFVPSLKLWLSMPTILGSNGIENILPIPLNEKEQKKLDYSAEQLRKLL